MNIFITGCYRSGTTLIQKYINSQIDSQLQYQPMIFLFMAIKELFYKENNIKTDKYIGKNYSMNNEDEKLNSFLNQKINITNLRPFLDKHRPTDKTLLENFNKIIYSLEKSKDLISIYTDFLDTHNSLSSSGSQKIRGVKEILCHEFVPYFLKHSVQVIVVIRNPVDVIKSLNHGNLSSDYTGGPRPTLLNLRNWRENSETAIRNINHQNLIIIQYEKFISDKYYRINKLKTLNINYRTNDLENLIDESGKQWKNNTSYSSNKKSDHRQVNNFTKNYIGATCYGEMKFFNYDPSINEPERENIIKNYKEQYNIISRPYYDKAYSTNPVNIKYEIERKADYDLSSFTK